DRAGDAVLDALHAIAGAIATASTAAWIALVGGAVAVVVFVVADLGARHDRAVLLAHQHALHARGDRTCALAGLVGARLVGIRRVLVDGTVAVVVLAVADLVPGRRARPSV